MTTVSSDSDPRYISCESAKTLLSAHQDDLHECIKVGWTKWVKVASPTLAVANPRTRANIVWNYVTDEARTRFGRRVIDLGDRFLLDFQDAVVRFKKLDLSYRTRNYPTTLAQAVEAQTFIPGAPPHAPVLTVGYQIDIQDPTLLAWIGVIYAASGRQSWQYSLENTAQVVEQLRLPAAAAAPVPVQPTEEALKARIRRRAKQEK